MEKNCHRSLAFSYTYLYYYSPSMIHYMVCQRFKRVIYTARRWRVPWYYLYIIIRFHKMRYIYPSNKAYKSDVDAIIPIVKNCYHKLAFSNLHIDTYIIIYLIVNIYVEDLSALYILPCVDDVCHIVLSIQPFEFTKTLHILR